MIHPLPSTRLAAASDVPVLIDLMEAFYAESGYVLNRKWATDTFFTLLRNKDQGETWLLYLGNEVVGYMIVSFRFSIEHGGREAFIQDLFVCPDQRRKGVARFALQRLFRECESRNIAAIQVQVGARNVAAAGLYKAQGLKPYDDGRVTLTARLREDVSCLPRTAIAD